MCKNVGDVDSGADRLRARQIKEDIKGLRDATEDVKRYADLVVAHNAREKPAPVAFSVISSATDEIVRIAKCYTAALAGTRSISITRVLRVRQSLEVIGTGKDRAVRFKAPKTEKSRRDVALTSGAIEVLRSQHARQSKLQLHLSGPFCDRAARLPQSAHGRTVEARHVLERVSAGRQSLWVTEGELPRASSLVRIDLATRRHALEGRFRNARSHDDRDHRGSLYARARRFESRCR